jgi:hypothetical protein
MLFSPTQNDRGNAGHRWSARFVVENLQFLQRDGEMEGQVPSNFEGPARKPPGGGLIPNAFLQSETVRSQFYAEFKTIYDNSKRPIQD